MDFKNILQIPLNNCDILLKSPNESHRTGSAESDDNCDTFSKSHNKSERVGSGRNIDDCNTLSKSTNESDRAGSEESNDMVSNYPDIEQIDQKRVRTEEQKLASRLKRLEKKKIAEEEALKKRKEQAIKGMKYLLTLSEKYSDFFKKKIDETHQTSKQPLRERNKFQPTINDMKEAADTKLIKSDIIEKADVTKQLKYFEGGTLHPYQIDGVSWMSALYDNGLNGILADEMGLGKTVQVIALICHLLEKGVPGPFLIIAALSILPNWESEFKRFAPKVPVIVFHGNQDERKILSRKISKKYPIDDIKTYPVIITSYQMPVLEERLLNRFDFQYIIIDEGHRIKNHESILSQVLRRFTCSNRLLLTGTPLQNNITELWSLLNFLMPQIFRNMDTFASLLILEDMQDGNKLLEEEAKTNFISTLHKVLAPFMLRRLKKDVNLNLVPKKEAIIYCPLSEIQRKLYSYVIDKNIKALLGSEQEEKPDYEQPRKKRKCVDQGLKYFYDDDDQIDDISDDDDFEDRLLNQYSTENLKDFKTYGINEKEREFVVRITLLNVMMYKKIVDHPYLVHFPLDPKSEKRMLLVNENLVNSSGKMKLLDVMLPKLRENGHKVLIFSTLVMTIDLIEEMMIMQGYTYRRLDGSYRLHQRSTNIDEFNKDPNILAFLLSTRAGGLGLNLTGADTVIFFDRDWNPQVDIQAQDRCHRIGQTRPVMVYTLVSKNTIDEKIITRGRQKRLLEKLVIKDGKFANREQDKVLIESELQELKELLAQENQEVEETFSVKELEKLLDRSELHKAMEESQKSEHNI